MSKPERFSSSRERVARRRAALRARGLRPKQFWLPDVTSADFIAQAQADSKAVAASLETADVQAWIDSLVGGNDWPAWKPE
jgi:DNA-binding LacI/PurR family transcriptional regulator